MLLLAGLVAVALVAAVLLLRSARAGVVDPVAQDQPGPVLLVPGYGGSLQSLAVLAAALRADGRDVTLVSLPGDATGDLRQQAQVLASTAKSVAARTNAGSVDVIGYSAGGVVARLWVKDYGGDRLARRVITLGSPQHGTDVAGVAAGLAPSQCPIACQQLAPDGTLLGRLNAGDETPAGPAYVSIWTTDDQVVTPPDSAALAGAVNIAMQSVCVGIRLAHGDLPQSSVVINAVRAEIGPGPVVPLAAGDCSRLRS
jgi:triacylglycerol esterase/lipase EstA (alpha/beta hydrolase family)